MIKKPTVLIVGAGASMDFGFPSGWGLVKRVLEGCAPQTVAYRAIKAAGFSPGQISGFRDALERSRAISVDAFLETRANLVDVGKAAIAAALIPCEHTGCLQADPPSWLHLLCERMAASRDEWGQNQLSIVTFNYDRLVEHFLHTSLMARYGMTTAKAADLLRGTVRIVHVHGQLGGYLEEESWDRSFEPQLSGKQVHIAAERMKIVHEKAIDDKEFRAAHAMLGDAAEVIFLGFGFGEANMSRLAVLQSTPNTTFRLGSGIGMTAHEQVRAAGFLGGGSTIDRSSTSLAQMLRSNPILGY